MEDSISSAFFVLFMLPLEQKFWKSKQLHKYKITLGEI